MTAYMEEVDWLEGEELLASPKQMKPFTREEWASLFQASMKGMEYKITKMHPLLCIVDTKEPNPLLFLVMGKAILAHNKDTHAVTYYKVVNR